MKNKNIGKMALAVALSTSFLAGNMADVFAEELKSQDPIVEENKDSESIATNAENAEENYKKAQEDEKKALDDLNDKKSEKEENLGEIKDAKDNLEEIDSEEKKAKEDLEKSLDAKKDETLGEKSTKEKDLEDLSNQDKEISSKVEKNSKDLEDKTTEKDDTEKDIEKAKEDNKDLLEEKEKAEKELEDAEADKKIKEESVKDLEEKSSAKTQEIEETKTKIEESKKELDQKKKELENITNTISEKEKSLNDKKDELSNMGDKDLAYKKLEEEISNLKKEKATYEDRIKTLEEENTKLEESLNNLKKKLSDLEASNKDYQNKVNGLENKEKSKTEEKSKLEEENKEIDKSKEELDKKVSEDKNNKTNLKKEIDTLNQEKESQETKVSDKQNKVNQSKKELEDAQKKLKAIGDGAKRPPTAEEIEAAKEKWARGSVGFFEANRSQDALDVFTKEVPYDDFHNTGANSAAYIEANKTYTKDDSRDLDRMKASIDAIEKLNKIRQEKGGIDGRELSIVGISDFEMAVAQANANYSQNRSHAKQYKPPFENLYWSTNPSVDGALEGWYSEEALFKELRKRGYKSKSEMDNALRDDKALIKDLKDNYGFFDNDLQVGHYTNIVDDLMWGSGFGGEDSVAAGYAIRPSDIFPDKEAEVHSLVLNDREGQEDRSLVYSVEEYKERFNKYYNNLRATVNGEAIITEVDQKAVDEAKALVDNLKEKLVIAENELQAEKENLNTINNNLSEKEKSLAKLNAAITENEEKIKQLDTKKTSNIEAISSLEKDLASINEQLDNLKEENKGYQAKHDDLSNKIKEKQENLETNKKEIASKSAIVNKLSEEIKNKEDDLLNIDKKRVQLSAEIEALEGEIENLKNEKETKTEEVDSIEKSLEEEKVKEGKLSDQYKLLASDLEKAKADLKLSEEERAQKQNKLDSIKKDLKEIFNLEEKLASLTKEIEGLEKKAKDLENAKNLNKEKVEKIKEALKDIDKELSDLDNIDLNNPETFEDRKDLSQKYNVLKNLRAAKTEKEGKLKALEENREKIKVELAKLEDIYKKKLGLTEIARQTWLSYFRDVEMDANGGLIQGESKIRDKKYYNDEIILELPQRLGYKFIAWLANGNKYLAGDKIKLTDNMTFTAIWERITIPQVEASGDNETKIPTDKDKSNKNKNKTEDKNSMSVAKIIKENNAYDKANKANPKTGITSVLAQVNALVALMFGYKNLKKRD